ncbi:hypothetical protein AAIG11_17675 [Anoxynatronum sibiricum]|uniref:Uncharacterized protein n=1 Tax=Anoxynatronum sibiricum TaxID=210623 RepID=A0ABU9VZ71_9CLOT
MTITAISQETGLSEGTLFKWEKEAKTKGFVITDGESSSDDWGSEDKFQIVLETAALNEAGPAVHDGSSGKTYTGVCGYEAPSLEGLRWSHASQGPSDFGFQ